MYNKSKDQDTFEKQSNKALKNCGLTVYPETKLKRISSAWRGRPDTIAVNTNTIFIIEKKSSAEIARNSWVNTYANDPISKDRIKNYNDYKKGIITRTVAGWRNVIAENDEHYEKKGITWDYPPRISSKNKIIKMCLQLEHNDNIESGIQLLKRILDKNKRNPKIITEDRITTIFYSPK